MSEEQTVGSRRFQVIGRFGESATLLRCDTFLNHNEETMAQLNSLSLQRNPVIRYRSRTCYMRRSVGYFVQPHTRVRGLSYARQTTPSQEMTPFLSAMCDELNAALGKQQPPEKAFNAVLINMFDNGSQFVAPHSDTNSDINQSVGIACISFGCERTVIVGGQKVSMPHNTLLYMSGETFQRNVDRRIPQCATCEEPFWLLSFHCRRDAKTPEQHALLCAKELLRAQQDEAKRLARETALAEKRRLKEEKRRKNAEEEERRRPLLEAKRKKKLLAETQRQTRQAQNKHEEREKINAHLDAFMQQLMAQKTADTVAAAASTVSLTSTDPLTIKQEKKRKHEELLEMHQMRKRLRVHIQSVGWQNYLSEKSAQETQNGAGVTLANQLVGVADTVQQNTRHDSL